jgi:drug/metabolite transporter (DMT)-like permease
VEGPLLLGVLGALGSSVLYSVGAALQALEARREPGEYGLHASLLRRLVTHRRWLLGTSCVLAGWTLQGVSLLFAPVTVVQPTLAVGLVSLLVIGVRLLREPVGVREVLGVLAVVAGVAGIALSAPPQSSDHADPTVLGLALAAFVVVALVPYALRSSSREHGGLVILSGGLAYAVCGFSTSFAGDVASAGRWSVLVFWLAVTGMGALIGLISEMTAFQHAPVTHVFPVMLVIQIVVTVVLAPLLAGESWEELPFSGFGLALSIAVVTSGAAALVGTRAIGAALANHHLPFSRSSAKRR